MLMNTVCAWGIQQVLTIIMNVHGIILWQFLLLLMHPFHVLSFISMNKGLRNQISIPQLHVFNKKQRSWWYFKYNISARYQIVWIILRWVWATTSPGWCFEKKIGFWQINLLNWINYHTIHFLVIFSDKFEKSWSTVNGVLVMPLAANVLA